MIFASQRVSASCAWNAKAKPSIGFVSQRGHVIARRKGGVSDNVNYHKFDFQEAMYTSKRIKRTMKRTLTAIAALLLVSTDAFTPSLRPSVRSESALSASRRREVFRWARNLAFWGYGASQTLVPDVASADDAVNGRVIALKVNNLGGEEGKTGTVRIQMAPEWAPKGVARFEVREYRYFAMYVCTSLGLSLTHGCPLYSN